MKQEANIVFSSMTLKSHWVQIVAQSLIRNCVAFYNWLIFSGLQFLCL